MTLITEESRYLGPLKEEVDAILEVDLHRDRTVAVSRGGIVERSVAAEGDGDQRAPAVVIGFVLQEFHKYFGRRNGNVERGVTRFGPGSDEPTILVRLLRKIPELIEGARDVVELARSHSCEGCGSRCDGGRGVAIVVTVGAAGGHNTIS